MYTNRLYSVEGEIFKRETHPELFAPLAKWFEREDYPAVIPLTADVKESQHRHLAWEFLRRMPRYRWQHSRLKVRGLLSAQCFPNGQSIIFSGAPVPRACADMCLDGHSTVPPAVSQETLAAFATRVSAENWVVRHGHDWACGHWGVTEIRGPSLSFEDGTVDLFSPSQPTFWTPSRWAAERKKMTVAPEEIILRFRADFSIERRFEKLRRSLSQYVDEYQAAQNTEVAKPRAITAPYLLRAWDAFQTLRDIEKPKDLFQRVYKQFCAENDATRGGARDELVVGRQTNSLSDFRFSLLKTNKVRHWVDLMEHYLLDADGSYRQLLFPDPAKPSEKQKEERAAPSKNERRASRTR